MSSARAQDRAETVDRVQGMIWPSGDLDRRWRPLFDLVRRGALSHRDKSDIRRR